MVRSTGTLLAARALAQLSLLGVSVLVARAVGPSDFGAYAALLAMGTVLVAGVGSGLPVLALRRVAAQDFDSALLRRIGCVQLAATAGATVAMAGLASIVVDVPGAFALGAVCGAGFVAFSLVTLASSAHAGAGQYRTAAIGEAAAAVGVAAFSVLAIGAGYGIMGALVAFGVGQAVSAAFLWSRLPEVGGMPVDIGVSAFRASESLPFVALGLAASGYARLDAVLVSAVATTTVVGIYAAAYRLLGVFSLLGNAFGTVFLSSLSAVPAGGHEWKRLKRRGTLLFAATALPLMCVTFALAPMFIRVLYGPQFVGATTPARWLLLSVLPYSYYLPTAFSLVATGRERRWALLLVGGSVTNLLAVLVLVPRWGATGAAVAWVVAESVICVAVVVSARSPRPPVPVSTDHRQ